MNEEKIYGLLSVCFDGNEDKIRAFLELLELLDFQETVAPVEALKMIIPEDCIHETEKQDCLLEFPDSINHCKQPCNFYVGCDSIRKLSEGE